MLEMIVNPKKVGKRPWEMFFVGLVYASLSMLLVNWIFSEDIVLSKYSGMIVITFSLMFSLPFLYYLIKQEEQEDEEIEDFFKVWKAHSDAVYAFMWLFLGFIVAFSFWHIILQNSDLLNAQIKTYCVVNSPGNIEDCVAQYTPKNLATGSVTRELRLLSILENNIYVMITTLVFSLIFGAGAIFILAWNASVIAAAIGIFSKYQLKELPLGIVRYMIHGAPEIAAYFITALAGGIIGVGVIRHGVADKRFLRIIENSVILLFIALLILAVAAIIEVYITPMLF